MNLPLFLISLGILAALAASAVLGNDDVERAVRVQEAHTDRLMANLNVVGTGVGYNPAGKVAVLVFTKERVDDLPDNLDGVPVHPVVTGVFSAGHHRCGHTKPVPGPCPPPTPTPDPTLVPPPTASDCPVRTAKYRPACTGISTGHPLITACTIGARVTKGGNVYALSNNHCYAASNAALIGDAVIQQGAYDGGISPQDDLGTLSDFEPLKFCSATCPDNVIDAAIALSLVASLGNATPHDGYGLPRSGTVPAYLGQPLKKYGRTTGQTIGQVYAINVTVNVGYGTPGTARFVGQVLITPGTFSAGGDSGSLVVQHGGADDRKGVGLLFAGSSSYTVANPINPVLSRFGVTVDGG